MINWLKLVRYPNLVIIIAVQFILQYKVIVPALSSHQIRSTLDFSLLLLLSMATIMVAASGYIINDIYDYETDSVNKPQKVIIPNIIPLRGAWKAYALLVSLGFLMSFSVATLTDKTNYLYIYPLAIMLLAGYSIHFKRVALIGNLVVALFCAFVSGIIFLAESAAINELVTRDEKAGYFIITVLVGYIAFGFIATLIREIIKDIEDMEGDRSAGFNTTATVFGMKKSKYLVFVVMLLLLFCLVYWIYIMFEFELNWNSWVFFVFGIIIPVIITVYRLSIALEKKDFRNLSTWYKWIMLMGILYLCVI